MPIFTKLICAATSAALAGFAGHPHPGPAPKDFATAPRASIDRFSAQAAHLQLRSVENGLPAANAAVNFDKAPFTTWGFTADGRRTRYYNFDVQNATAAPVYWLIREGSSMPVDGQAAIVDEIPGDAGYNDFRQVVQVTVPKDYEANMVTSAEGIRRAGWAMKKTGDIVNMPLVPEGSKARRRFGGGSSKLQTGWYRDQVVKYFVFEEKKLAGGNAGQVPLSPILVTFNVNPDQPGGGPPSGFRAEPSGQTHNVVATVPSDPGYSPLWVVSVYDNADWAHVKDLPTAQKAHILGTGVALVNCPIVEIK